MASQQRITSHTVLLHPGVPGRPSTTACQNQADSEVTECAGWTFSYRFSNYLEQDAIPSQIEPGHV